MTTERPSLDGKTRPELTEHWYGVGGINPEPWEASQVSVGRKGNQVFPRFYKPTQLSNYQEALASNFQSQNPGFKSLEGELDIAFYFWRELPDYTIGEGKRRRAKPADATNLIKAAEDALQGILYVNDKSNRRVTGEIMQQDPETSPFILIRVSCYRPDPMVVIMRGQIEVAEPIRLSNQRELPDDDVPF